MTRSPIVLLIFHLIATSVSAVEIRVASFNIGAYFGENFFEYSLGDPGTPDHDKVRAILERIDADVVALQEIHSVDLQGSPDDLDALAAALGYPYLSVPPVTGVLDTSLRAVFLSRFPFLASGSIAPPAGARDMTRRHPIVKVDVPGTANDPWLASVHLKAGTDPADRFRRAVEMRRLVGHLASAGLGDDDNFIVLGDFNPSAINTTFQSLPSGLPGTFVLGPDISLPVSYTTDMTAYFTSPSVVKLDPRQLNGSPSTYNTTAAGGPILDLILVSPAIAGRPSAAEIYNSTLDTSNSTGLPKAGVPLADNSSALASDHYAVFADLNLGADVQGPYVFTAPGQTLRESFDGFTGNQAPARWSAAGDDPWLGSDDGSSEAQGWRAYGSGNERAPGLLATGAARSLTAEFANQSARRLTALQVAIDAEIWRPLPDGAEDSLAVELITPAGTLPIETLRFVAGANPGTLSAIVGGVDIAPGASFSLRVSLLPGASGGSPPAEVFINELHYDNTGTDADEFVEIVAGPGFSGNLADVALVLYNGADGGSYATHALNTFTAGAVTASGHRLFHKSISGIQNGGPDGMALVVNGVLRQFLSYEGTFTATGGPASGLSSTDIGVSQNGTEPLGQSALGLVGNGGNPADFTWNKFTGLPHSPGQPNAGQSFVNAPKPPQGLAFDNLAVTYLTDNDQDGEPDIGDPDDDNDGQSDADETAFGVNPLSAASRFAPVLMRNGSGLMLSFPAARNVAYTVEMSETLHGWREHSRHVGAGAVIEVALPSAEPRMFFRVRAGGL